MPKRGLQLSNSGYSNAVIYCPGQVKLTVKLSAPAESARFDLFDNGPGIAPNHANELFEPFRRASTGGSGRGLGLWICKVIVEAHGGRIGIGHRSQGGHFWFELPVNVIDNSSTHTHEEVMCSTSQPRSET